MAGVNVFDVMTGLRSYVTLSSDWLTPWSRTSVTQYENSNLTLFS